MKKNNHSELRRSGASMHVMSKSDVIHEEEVAHIDPTWHRPQRQVVFFVPTFCTWSYIVDTGPQSGTDAASGDRPADSSGRRPIAGSSRLASAIYGRTVERECGSSGSAGETTPKTLPPHIQRGPNNDIWRETLGFNSVQTSQRYFIGYALMERAVGEETVASTQKPLHLTHPTCHPLLSCVFPHSESTEIQLQPRSCSSSIRGVKTKSAGESMQSHAKLHGWAKGQWLNLSRTSGESGSAASNTCEKHKDICKAGAADWLVPIRNWPKPVF